MVHIVADENIPFVKDAFSTFGDVHVYPGRSICRENLHDAEILLVRSVTPVTRELLEGTPVKFVATATIGTDHIDQEYLRQQYIDFSYAPGSNAESVAEYVVAALCVLKEKYQLSLERSTLGIIGCGNIGSRIHRYAGTLGMRTLLCDPPRKRQTGSELFLSFQEVIAQADIITFHVPLTIEGDDRTLHMVDDTFFAQMKKNAIVINTSRGKVIDEHAVLRNRNKLGGLVLDVWNNEPSIATELLELSDIATPHIAGYSFDGKLRGTDAIYTAACAWYQTTASWSSQHILGRECRTVSISPAEKDPVSSAILQAYPILDDDERLRRILILDTHEQSAWFDTLRKTYYKRLEFSHFTVENQYPLPEVALQLRELGFSIVP